MLYRLIKPFALLFIKIYCKRIYINNKNLLNHSGPLLLACNHPNSFLDAILLCVFFKKPIYALARGDSFKKKWAAKILFSLNIYPIYREREGVENLHLNYNTFDKCLEVFRNKGIVLIFSEALCINEWHLRPIKKGTAKLAHLAWQQNIPLQVLPIGLNYSNFCKTGKIIHINFGDKIHKKLDMPESKSVNDLTKEIQIQLNKLVYEIDKNNISLLKKYFNDKNQLVKKIIFLLPAAIGFLSHAFFYYPLYAFINKKAKNTGHYDAIIMGITFITYPFFIGGYVISFYFLLNSRWGMFAIILLPLCAWSYNQFKNPI